MNDLLEKVESDTPIADAILEKHDKGDTQVTVKGVTVSPHAQKPGPVTHQPQISMGDMINTLATLAENPAVDPAKMSAIMDLQERMMNKDAEMQFNRAMAAMQAEMPVIKKDGSVEYEKDGHKQKAFDFASFENIMKAVKPVLSTHGFAIRFDTDERNQQGGGAVIKATLSHEGGHSVETKFAAALDSSGGKNNIQAMGSTYSYGKRYCVTALLNIVTEGEDDDGNKAFLEQPIDQEEFEEIQRLLELNETDAAKYCGHLGITSLKAMPKKMFMKACHDLKARAQKVAERKAIKEGEENDNK